MTDIFISKPVARTVVESTWFTQADGTSHLYAAFRRAATSRFREKALVYSTSDVADLVAIVEPVLAELKAAAAKDAVIEPLLQLKRNAEIWQERFRINEARQEAERAEVETQRVAESRKWRTQRRETPMTPEVESSRFKELREIAEDYGLNIKDVQVRAALVAAFRAGAFQFQQATNNLLYKHTIPRDVDMQKWEERFAKDAQMFTTARALTTREEPA